MKIKLEIIALEKYKSKKGNNIYKGLLINKDGSQEIITFLSKDELPLNKKFEKEFRLPKFFFE
jgi:hypothetical protein